MKWFDKKEKAIKIADIPLPKKKYKRELEIEGIVISEFDTAEQVKQKLSKFRIVEGIGSAGEDGFFHVYTTNEKINFYTIWFNGHCKTSKIWLGPIYTHRKKTENWSDNDCEPDTIPWKDIEIIEKE